MPQTIAVRLFRLLSLVIPLSVLMACGQGSGPEPVPGTAQPAETGILIDSPVSGVTWEASGGLNGTTNNLGEFQYGQLEAVTFSIGDIVLGTAQGAPYISMVELTGSTNPTDQAAVNQLVFLQSIDSDQDPTNGITVSPDTASLAAGVTLDFEDPDFSTEVVTVVAAITEPDNAVVTESDALGHFYTTYADLGGTDTFNFLFPGFPPVGGNNDEYVLVFADEFEEGTAPSPDNWTIETGYGPSNNGWGNNEWQLYTESPDNVRVEDGNLVLEARCPVAPCGVRDGTVTSGKVNTLDKFNFKYGKIIARIKPPVGEGSWPAFWSLGANYPEVGWPRSGEIDFMEIFQGTSDERTTHHTMHWCDETIQAPATCSFPDGWKFFTQSRTFTNSLGDDFHVFETEWNEDGIIGKIDGLTYFTRTIDPGTMDEFLKEFYMILNVAMGGTLGSDNQPPSGNEVFPQTMLVDYVRVFQLADDGSEPITGGLVTDFEEAPDSYDFGADGGFAGGASSVIANPQANGINTSAQVGRMIKFAGDVFGGSTLVLPDPVQVPEGSSFTMKVWSPREVDVLFKLEGGPPGEVTVTHSGSGWEELTFDFPTLSGEFTGVTFIFDLGTLGDADNDPQNWTFYFDDITLVTPDDGGSSSGFPVGFEDGAESFTDFGGGAVTTTPNPVPSGLNTSATVGSMQKLAGEAFGGSTLDLGSNIDFSLGTAFKMNVLSLREVDVLMRLQGTTVDRLDTYSGSSGWEELCFDFTGATDGVTTTGLSVVFDPAVVGDAENDPFTWTFFFDDIEQTDSCPGGGSGGIPGLVTDFEDDPNSYDFGADGGFGGGAASVVTNPDMSGINISAQVGEMLKFAGEVFGGATLALSEALDIPANSAFTMKVWSQREVPVLFKLEGGAVGEISVTHTGTGWEDLTFDFADVTGSITGITLIFDNGVNGAAASDPQNWTFYFDDIILTESDGSSSGGGTVEAAIDFEAAGQGADFEWNVFKNGDNTPLEIITNPDQTGVNPSATVAKFTARVAGEPFAGAFTDDLETFTLDETNSMVSLMVWKPVISDVGIKFETAAFGTTGEIKVANTVTNQWEELLFDFSGKIGEPTSTDITRLTVFPDFDARAQENVVYFDNMDFSMVPATGGGTPNLVADFEGDPASWDFGVDGGFGGGASEVIDNPDMSSINTSAQVARMLKFAGEVFGGSTLVLPAPLTIPAGSTFTMKVWSQREVPVLFKLEGGPASEISVTHSGSGWEELTYDFSAVSGSITGITFIFDLGVGGDAMGDAANWTFYFDDIVQIVPDN